jgi:hypothetical protein
LLDRPPPFFDQNCWGIIDNDADCDGTDEDDVRTVQQRLEFELTERNLVCDCVQLTDAGASGNDPSCVLVMTDTLDEEICAAGVFAGQLVAATINAAFSQYNADNGEGSLLCGGGRSFPGGLGDLVYVDGCVHDDLVGLTVNEVIAMANCVIGADCGSCGVPADVTISDLSDALTTLNENFVDCDTDEGCLD